MTPLLPRLAICLPLVMAGAVAWAESPLSPAQFEEYVEGRTLYFNSGGVEYGVEEYLPNRRVRWSFLDGECKDGDWYPVGNQICFEYEDGTGPQCWTFFQDTGGLRAKFQGGDFESELYEARKSDKPMVCLGPKVGV